MLTLVACSGQFTDGSMYHADWPYFNNVDELVAEADLIIIGEAVSANRVEALKIFADSDETILHTVCEVRVTQVIKGKAEVGEIITVKQLGDYKTMPDSAHNEVEGYVKKDSTNLMFLSVFDSVPAEPLNPFQAVVSIEDGKLVSKSKYSWFGYEQHESVEEAVTIISVAVANQSKGE